MVARSNLASLIDDMDRLGDQLAVVEHRGVRRLTTTYRELAHGAQGFAAELLRREIHQGDRIVLWGENSAAWIACFFGCVLRGVLVAPLDAAGLPEFAERIVHDTAPRLVVGDQLLLDSLGGATATMSLGHVRAAFHSPAGPSIVAESLTLDTPLQILFTSGATGEPKGVVHTHRNLLASLTPIEREIAKHRRYERVVHPLHVLHTLPLSHVFGQFMGLWVAPVLGAVVHYESRLEARRLLRLLRRERISVLAAVPRVLALLRTALLAGHPALSSELADAAQERIARRWWRFRQIHSQLGYRFWAIVCGGATLPEPLESFWTTLGVALIQGYGMTETSALVTLNHPFKPARGTLGTPLPGRELRISAESELLVRGEMVATTTWRNGALRPAAGSEGNDGWLATGDLTRRDEAGRLHFLGRTGQRLVTAAGLNVYLEDVEAAVAMQPGVNAAVVVTFEGVEGPEPAAVLLATGRPEAAKAIASANESLASHQRVRRWWLWPGLDLPRTATGKVRRHLVETWVRGQMEAVPLQPNPDSPGDPLLRLLASVTGRSSADIEALSPTQKDGLHLEALGVDSLGRVQMQVELERATGRMFDDAEMTAIRTLGELRRLSQLPDAAEAPLTTEAATPSPEDDKASAKAAPARDMVHSPSPASYLKPASLENFLYLRWPWSAPVQIMRTLFIEGCVRPLVWLLAAPRVDFPSPTTRQTLLEAQPLLIVANHLTAYDLPLIMYALPSNLRRRIATATAGEMLEDWRQSRSNLAGPAIFWLLTLLFNVFPLPRNQGFRLAFEHAGKALDRGYSVLIFPEGARSHGGDVRPFRGGIGLLAQQAGVFILPISLQQARAKTGLRPYLATIRIGELVTIHDGQDARTITTRLESAVKQLLG